MEKLINGNIETFTKCASFNGMDFFWILWNIKFVWSKKLLKTLF